MSLVELLALTTAIIVIVKTVILLKSQRFWYGNITSRYWKGSGNLTMFLSFIVASITLMILLRELTIIQIWAVMLFAMALISMALAPLIVWYFWPAPELVTMQIVLSLILFWRHRSNIRNLLSGAEGRISQQQGSEEKSTDQSES